MHPVSFFPRSAVTRSTSWTGRSSDSRIILPPEPSHLVSQGSGLIGLRPRLQRRDRAGFSPASLLSAIGTCQDASVTEEAAGSQGRMALCGYLFGYGRKKTLPVVPPESRLPHIADDLNFLLITSDSFLSRKEKAVKRVQLACIMHVLGRDWPSSFGHSSGRAINY